MARVWVNGVIIEGSSAREILPSVLRRIRLRGGDGLSPVNFAAVAGWNDREAALAAGVFYLAAKRLGTRALAALPEPFREEAIQLGAVSPDDVVGIGEELANLLVERWSDPKLETYKTRLIIVGSSKGGLGKTSLAMLVSGHEMTQGRFVAVVDMDPNGSSFDRTSVGLKRTIWVPNSAGDNSLNRTSVGLKPSFRITAAPPVVSLNRTSVGLKRSLLSFSSSSRRSPQSNQRGIETKDLGARCPDAATCLNRTSVGLKPMTSFRYGRGCPEPQSNQRGIETSDVTYRLEEHYFASIEPAWD